MIIITKFMDKTATLPARVQATVLGRHARKMHAVVPWRSSLSSRDNHRKALGKLLMRLNNNGDVQCRHNCAQAYTVDSTRYWVVATMPSIVRPVEDLIKYYEETTPC